jgi:hypothetical protein
MTEIRQTVGAYDHETMTILTIPLEHGSILNNSLKFIDSG